MKLPQPDFAKSYCTCHHSGDGLNSNHRDDKWQKGHGECLVIGCGCRKFTWGGYYQHFLIWLRNQYEKEEVGE